MNHPSRQIDAHLQHGKRLHGAGRLAEAGQVYQQVLSVAPAHPEALHMMGVLLLQMGQPAQALEWLDRAIGADGSGANGSGANGSGASGSDAGGSDAGGPVARRAKAGGSKAGKSRSGGSHANGAQGSGPIAQGPVAAFHVHRAHALLALGRAAEAEAACRVALQLKRGNVEAHQALGHALTDTGDYQGALKAYQDAARLKPDLPDLLNNLGTALHHANRLDEAARTLTRAHGREPRDPGILVNLSSVLRDLGLFAQAEARLAAASRIAPHDPRVRYNNALLMLLLGRFEKAWPGWEERFRAGAVRDRGLATPRWHGEALAGRTLLIHAEQGLGDTIQFCRYPFPADGKVVFEVQPRIARLLASRNVASGGSRPSIVRRGDALPGFDLECPLMSLPAIHATTEATIPGNVPYLSAVPDAVERWRGLLGGHGFRVGIAWQGNPSRREDSGRSIRLEHYLPFAAIPGVRLISLQRDAGAEQLAPGLTVETLGDDFDLGPDGFIDAAAVMMNLDLVISSDTAIPHLAGALGRPVWVALRAVPDWRFMLERTDSPWYPTMRLFRQTVRDEWAPVFAAMKDALARLVAGHRAGGHHVGGHHG